MAFRPDPRLAPPALWASLHRPAPKSSVSRRMLWLGTAGSAALGAALGALLSWASQPGDPAPDPDLEWALQLADGELARLVEQLPTFLVVFGEKARAHPDLWRGLERVARALLDSDPVIPAGQLRHMARSVVDAAARFDAPAEVGRLVGELRAALQQ